MPPSASVPPRKRPKPYNPSDRPKQPTSTSQPGEGKDKDRVAMMGSSKARRISATGLPGIIKSGDVTKSKLQRIRSNESSGSRREGDEGGEGWKKNRKKKRKVGIASSIGVPAEAGAGEKEREMLVESGAANVDEKPKARDQAATPKSNGNPATPALAQPPLSPGSKVMMHTAMDQQMKALNRKTAEIERLQAELKAATEEKEAAGKKERELAAKVGELERECAEHREATDGKDKKLEEHRVAREALLESCQCGVCMDILDDPHTLSCGHIACKKCLISWFRTPGAYHSPLPNPVPADKDLSYWRKSCHVCRAVVIRRPTRLFFLRDILGPLGIDPHIPTSSQQDIADPWNLTFPTESSSYRIFDEDDRVQRCPNCGSEIMDSICHHCAAEFSSNEDEYEGASDGDDMSDDEGLSEGEVEVIRQRGAPRWRRPGQRGFLADAMRQADAMIDDEADEESGSSGSEDEDDDGSSQLSDGGESDDVDSELGSEADNWPAWRGGDRLRRDLPPTQPRNRRRDHEVELVQGEDDEDEDEDQYEGSFINDDASDGARALYVGSDEDDFDAPVDSDDLSGDSDSEDSDEDSDEESDSECSSVMELDAPPVEDMRHRRLGRVEQHPAAPAPAQRIVSNEQAAVRRPAGRRARPIVIDSDDE